MLQVRLDDPKRLITHTDDIHIGIYLPSGLFYPMRLGTSDPTGCTYEVAVPLKTAVRVTIISTHLQMTDDKGKDLAPHGANPNSTAPPPGASSTLTIPAPSAANGPPITFTVTGRK